MNINLSPKTTVQAMSTLLLTKDMQKYAYNVELYYAL